MSAVMGALYKGTSFTTRSHIFEVQFFCFLPAPRFVLFFVRVPPLGWLGVFIIVLFFVLRATPWLARGYDYCFVFCLRTAPWLVRGYYYRFHYRYRACALFRFGVGVFNVLRGGVRFPNEVGVW